MSDSQIPKRPEFLNKLLSLRENKDEYKRELYINFLGMVKQSQNAMKDLKKMDVKMFCKTSSLKPDDQNSSLRLIFNFYAKLQPPSNQLSTNPTYAQIEYANETLSFFELLTLCRDFRVAPRLITREELKFLWKIINIKRMRGNETTLGELDFDEFIDFLSKIAILAYSKPGMLLMMETVHGLTPTPALMIESIGQYMHLDDEDKVRYILQTTGRKTVARYNMRTPGERNIEVCRELRQDLKGKRISKLLSTEVVTETEMRHTGYMPSLAVPSVEESFQFRPRSDIPEPVGELGTFSLATKVGDNQAVHIAKTVRKSMNVTSANPIAGVENATTESLLAKVTDMARNGNFGSREEEEEDDELDGFHAPKGRRHNESNFSERFNLRKVAEVPGAYVSDGQVDAIVNYDKKHNNLLTKYSKEIKGKGVIPVPREGLIESNGPFLDLGDVTIGQKVTVELELLNVGSDPIQLDVVTEDFQSEDISVVFGPRLFARGISKNVKVAFTVARGVDCAIGIIKLLAAPGRGQPAVLACPVYYRVEGAAASSTKKTPKGERPVSATSRMSCTAKSLPAISAKLLAEGGGWRSGAPGMPSTSNPSKQQRPTSSRSGAVSQRDEDVSNHRYPGHRPRSFSNVSSGTSLSNITML